VWEQIQKENLKTGYTSKTDREIRGRDREKMEGDIHKVRDLPKGKKPRDVGKIQLDMLIIFIHNLQFRVCQDNLKYSSRHKQQAIN